MTDYQYEVQKLVEGFVAALSDVWRRRAIDTLTGGMAGARGHGGHAAGGLAATTGGITSGGRGRGRGGKRSADELDQLSDAFVEFVTKNPGLRIEQINKQLGTKTKDLALPIRKLLTEGAIKAKGKRRSTAYFPSEGQRKKVKGN